MKIGKSYYGIPNKYSSLNVYIEYLKEKASQLESNVPKNTVKAILVPHAGLTYSGLGACQGYLSCKQSNKLSNFNTIVILSTFHNSSQYNPGLYLPKFDKFHTPLGAIYNNKLKIKELINKNSYCHYGTKEMFEQEHSVLFQLPLIQNIYGNNTKIIPILCGDIANQIRKDDSLIKLLLQDNVLVVCNTDLSHVNGRFVDRVSTSLQLLTKDNAIITNILNVNSPVLKGSSCCGIYAIQVLKKFLIYSRTRLYPRIGCYYTSQIDVNSAGFKLSQLVDIESGFNPSDSSVSYLTLTYSSTPYISKRGDRKMKHLLTNYERMYLVMLASKSIQTRLNRTMNELGVSRYAIRSPAFELGRGIFVTLKRNNKLRGCIGTLSINKSILENVIHYARQSAFNDSRFSPLGSLLGINLTISVLADKRKITLEDYLHKNKYIPGNDGIELAIIKNGIRSSGFFLPSVYLEQGWNKVQQLEHLCSKAGLSNTKCYLGKDDRVELYYMEGFEF